MSVRLISGLSEIASQYDALICDVWGVVHDGHKAHDAACDALRRFRRERGPVVLLTNAPRVPAAVAEQCAGLGVPRDCYDTIVSSGGAARAELVKRCAGPEATAQPGEAKAPGAQSAPVGQSGAPRPFGAAHKSLPLYYIGTDRDVTIYQGLDVALTGLEEAKAILCTGLRDDDTDTPADYADELAKLAARGLTMLCANPDLVVHRGSRLYWCAGALARDYAALGGTVLYYGKPHGPVYDMARAEIAGLKGGTPAARPLAIGDGMPTDIKGANAQGLDTLFIADGIHGEEIEPYTEAHITELLGRGGLTATASLRDLRW
jgi:HAD superfamily hydrolase (TIGR01450 family)